MAVVNIALVEDHNLVRQGFEQLISTRDNYRVVLSVENADSLLQRINNNDIDVVITDIQMRGIDGLALAEVLKSNYPQIKVVVLSMHESIYYVEKAKSLQIDGYISKRFAADTLLNALDTVISGSTYYEPMLDANQINSKKEYINYLELTSKEKEIFISLAKGIQIKKIASFHNIAIKTVHSHKGNIFAKLNIFEDFAITRLALKLGLIDVVDL